VYAALMRKHVRHTESRSVVSLNLELDWSCDLGMEFLAHACQVIDQTLERQYAFIDADFDLADQAGVPDMAEYLIGLGFAACQGYITGVCAEMGVQKADALLVGPEHATGATIASLTNHAANWWKHCDEWSDPPTGRALQTYSGLKALGVSGFYPLYDALRAMTSSQQPLFRELTVQLSAWRDAVLEMSLHQSPGV
jgi:hypothetical protein